MAKPRKQPSGKHSEAHGCAKLPIRTKIPCDFSQDQSMNDSLDDDPTFPILEKGYSPAKHKTQEERCNTHEKGTPTKKGFPTKNGERRKETTNRTTTYNENEAISRRQGDALLNLRMSPGAVPVQGASPQANAAQRDGEDKQVTNNWNSDSIVQLVVAAEIAPDDEDTAARMAERMEQQIKDEVEARLCTQHRTEVVAEAVVAEKAVIFCGIQRSTCLCILLILVFVTGGTTTGVILNKGNDDRYVPPTASPIKMPTTSPTPPPTRNEKMEALRQELERYIIRTEEDLILFDDPTSPQSLALKWLSTDPNSISDNRSTVFILERYVLAVLYFSTNGHNWRFPDLPFMSDVDACEWNNGLIAENEMDKAAMGIYCDGRSPVRNITFNKVGLGGTLPWELSLLSELAFLHMNNNGIAGSIPPEFGELTKLQGLNLGSNQLRGLLPVNFSSSIQYMDLATNYLEGSISTAWGAMLSNAIHLKLDHNELSGQLPSELGRLTTLKHLAIDNNAFTGPIPSELGQLTVVTEISMNNNNFTGTVPAELARLSQMKFLSIQNNGLTGSVNDTLCLHRTWKRLVSDCADGNPPEIECDCCTLCCPDTLEECAA